MSDATSKVFAVFEFAETDGDAIDVCSGIAYSDKALADSHANRVWGGSVREIEVRTSLPPWVDAAGETEASEPLEQPTNPELLEALRASLKKRSRK